MTPETSAAPDAGALAAWFTDFYVELHQDESHVDKPYEWQRRIAIELARGEEFGELVAPTGAGKTTLIECFLFALAEQLERGQRSIPLRLYWVIDRRAVVDQVFQHARTIADRLRHAGTDTAVGRVAAGLRRGTGGAGDPDRPVEVRMWRGGTDRGIERVPLAAPCVVCSTVDQVGSRLLFRGYGTAPRFRAIDAALVGTDSLIVLDEAHLSQPFASTTASVRDAQGRAHREGVRMARLMHVSATPAERTANEPRFELTSEELAEELLARRLRASKRVRLERVPRLSEGLAQAAKGLADGGRVVGVVANTVGHARAVHKELSADADALLLIGPSRRLDRESVLADIPDRDGQDRAAREAPLFVVGTQTLEVGLDLDFDALISACAPFPSLVQRFGRLDRAGVVTQNEGFAPGVIVLSEEPCPVYGDAVTQTWKWLESRANEGELDFGPDAVTTHLASDPPEPPVGPLAPILGPWHVEALAQTSRDPVPTPEIGFFLHGEDGAREADVAIAWRCDIEREHPEEWEMRIRARPPHPGELLSLPVAKVRRWLAERGDDVGFGDIESTTAEDTGGDGAGGERRGAVAFGRIAPPGPDGAWGVETGVESADVRPGDVLVVPSSSGGCDRFGWAPASLEPVDDLGDLNPERPRILLGPETALGPIPDILEAAVKDVLAELATEDTNGRDAYRLLSAAVREWLADSATGAEDQGDTSDVGGREDDSVRQARYEKEREAIIEALTGVGTAVPLPLDAPRSLVLEPLPPHHRYRTAARQPYEEHVERVVGLATAYARSQDLDEDLVHTIRLAARYHDLGKRDPRFQAWLNRGVLPPAGVLLAKSDIPPNHPRSNSYRIASGWPRGKRHEMTSAVMVQKALSTGAIDGCDPDLLIHLVAVHHGQLRPFLPMRVRRFEPDRVRLVAADEPDTDPVTVTAPVEGISVSVSSDEELDFAGHAERFAELNERYGPWGLAALEATLVLADRLASAEVG